MNKKTVLFSVIIFAASLIVCYNGCGSNKSSDDAAEPAGEQTAADEPDTDDNNVIPGLSSLIVSTGSITPDFSFDIYHYEVSLTSEVSELVLTTVPSAGCSVEIDNTPVTSEDFHSVISISSSVTETTVLVNNENDDEISYSLLFKRMEEKHISNSSFEVFNTTNNPIAWEVSGSGEVKSSSAFFHTGSYSGTFTTLTGSISGRELLSLPIEIEQGKRIIVSAWFCIDYIEGLSPERDNMSLKLYYFADETCGYPAAIKFSTMAKTFLSVQGSWEKIKYELSPEKLPEDAHFVRIGLRVCYDKNNGGTRNDRIFFDDISLQQ